MVKVIGQSPRAQLYTDMGAIVEQDMQYGTLVIRRKKKEKQNIQPGTTHSMGSTKSLGALSVASLSKRGKPKSNLYPLRSHPSQPPLAAEPRTR